MVDPFEAELEALVAKMSRELAQEITRLILRRLGLEGALRGARGDARGPAGAMSKALQKAANGRGARSTPRGKVRPIRARRASPDERAAVFDQVVAVVARASGLSVGEVERASGLSRPTVIAALKALKEQERVYMGGTKRFARYALTQAVADKASLDARSGASD